MAMPRGEWLATLGERVGDLSVALSFATRLPVALVSRPDSPPLARALRVLPLVGALVGAMAAVTYLIAVAFGLESGLAALLAIAASVLVTGALHEDGLADFTDGIGGGATVELRLTIMRDSRIGTFGVLAIFFVLGLRVMALAQLGSLAATLAISALVAAASLSRVAPVLLLDRLPPARRDGLSWQAGRPDSPAVREAMIIGLLVAGLALIPAAGAGALSPPSWPLCSPISGRRRCRGGRSAARPETPRVLPSRSQSLPSSWRSPPWRHPADRSLSRAAIHHPLEIARQRLRII